MQQKALTLLDLIIVAVIIAILAGVAVPQYLTYNRKAEAAEKTGLKTSSGHIELVQSDGQPGFAGDSICGCCFCWRI